MKLVRYNPVRTWNPTGNLFDRFFNDSFFYPENDNTRTFSPRVDIVSNDDEFEINVELAGVKKEDLNIDLKDNVLTIKGEKKYKTEVKEENFCKKERFIGSFERRFSLSDDVLTDEIDASLNDGILTIRLPKNKEEVKDRQITVN